MKATFGQARDSDDRDVLYFISVNDLFASDVVDMGYDCKVEAEISDTQFAKITRIINEDIPHEIFKVGILPTRVRIYEY